jgi:hypothetical protein
MAKRPRLIRGKDYVITDDGMFEFTREYLAGLGECCGNKCRNCPYREAGRPQESESVTQSSAPVAEGDARYPGH